MHPCPECGIEHGEPEPVVVEDNSDKAAEAAGEASVEVARIEAKRDVDVARIQNRGLDEQLAADLAALQARIDVLEAAAIPPEPEPVVLPVPEPEPEPEPVPAPEETPVKEEHREPARKGFF